MPTNIREVYEKNKREHITALVNEYRDIYNSIPSNQEMTPEQDQRIISIVATLRRYRDEEK